MTAPTIEQTAYTADIEHRARALGAELRRARWQIESALARVNQGDVFDDPARVVLLLVDLRDILTGPKTGTEGTRQ